MLKQVDDNEPSESNEINYSQFNTTLQVPLLHHSKLKNNLRDFQAVKEDSHNQNSESIYSYVPTDDEKIPINDSPSAITIESTNKKLRSVDSQASFLVLTPSKNSNSSSTSACELSPVLQSCFTKCWNDNKVISSTPEISHLIVNNRSSEPMNTEILDVLNQLCSPVEKENSPKISNSFSHKDGTPVLSNVAHCGRSVKRLFDSTSDNVSSFCQSKRRKLGETSECNTHSDSIELLDPFNEHDISERTLIVICEGTNHLINTTHQEPKFQIQNNDKTLLKELGEKSVCHNQLLMVPCDSYKTKLDHHNSDLGLHGNTIDNTPTESSATLNFEQLNLKSSIIYSSVVKESVESNRIAGLSLNDLLADAKVLEYANKFTVKNSGKLNKQLEKYNISHQPGFLPVETVTSKDKSDMNVKHKPLLDELIPIKDANLEQASANDSLGITDTQFCEVVEAVEMITDLNNEYDKKSLNLIKDQSISEHASTINKEQLPETNENNIEDKEILSKEICSSQTIDKNVIALFSVDALEDLRICHRKNDKILKEANLEDRWSDSCNGNHANKNHNHCLNGDFHVKMTSLYADGERTVQLSNEQSNNLTTLNFDAETNVKGKFEVASGNNFGFKEETLDQQNQFLEECNYSNVSFDVERTSFQTNTSKSDISSKVLLNNAQQYSVEEISSANPFFNGFYSASGKQVKVTEESLKSAKILFSDQNVSKSSALGNCGMGNEINNVAYVSEPLVKGLLISQKSGNSIGKTAHLLNKFGFNGLKTPSVTTFSRDDSGVQKEKSQIKPSLQKYSENSATFSKPQGMFKGFSSASGKLVGVSENSLKKARKLLEDSSTMDSSVEENKHLSAFLPDDSGFEKEVSKPEQSLQRYGENSVTFSKPQEILKGFSTASGKLVGVSEMSLKKAKKLLEENNYIDSSVEEIKHLTTFPRDELSFEEELDKSEQSLQRCIKNSVTFSKPQGILKGFSTASGKLVGVSEKSLKKARKLLEDSNSMDYSIGENKHLSEFPSDDSGFEKEISKSEQSLQRCIKNSVTFSKPQEILKGFSTASGKLVGVSEKSLKNARKLFENTSDEEIKQALDSEDGLINVNSISKFKSLISLNQSIINEKNEVTKISTLKDTIDLPVMITKDSNEYQAGHILGGENASTAAPMGFQTASGKSVNVSDLSLEAAKQLFSEEGFCDKTTSMLKSSSSTKMDHSTRLSSKKVYIDNLDHCCDIKPPVFEGFSTANGNLVSVSKESINKAIQIFSQETSADVIQENPIQINERTCTHSPDTSMLVRNKTNNEYGVESPVNIMKRSGAYNRNNTGNMEDFDSLLMKDKSLVNVKSTLEKVKPQAKNQNQMTEKETYDDEFNFITQEIQLNSMATHIRSKPVKCSEHISKHNKIGCVNSHKNASNTEMSNCVLKTTQNHKRQIENAKQSKCSTQMGPNWHNHNNSIKSVPFKNDVSSNFSSSVISEDDLSLLNETLCNNQNEFVTPLKTSTVGRSKTTFLSNSVDREVSESMAALVADEESNSPFSKQLTLKPLLSSPAMIFDRSDRLSPIICHGSETQLNNEYNLSPVLVSSSYFRPKKNLKKKLFHCTNTAVYENNLQATALLNTTPSFKPPYTTSTPKENVKEMKINNSLDFGNTPLSKRPKTELEYINLTTDEQTPFSVKEARSKAAEAQEKSVLDKKMSLKKTKPCKGLLLTIKQSEKGRKLKSLASGQPLQKHTVEQLLNSGVSLAVLEMSVSSAKDFKFSICDHFSEETTNSNVNGVPVGDGAILVLDADGQVGVNEFTRAFQASPGVDPGLAESSWIANHYRWIVLKLASIERMFPESFGNRCLTPNNLMLQLKYRYDREVDRCERPILRKILERDETPARTMVLFVADVIIVQSKECGERKELELSDGWYSIRTSIDSEMEKLISRKKVEVGTKLVICGAELIGNEDGCNPLETPAGVRLKVSTNSCRRARWFARLGLLPCSPPPLALHAVLPRGGAIQQVAASVARVYPLLYREKQPDGRSDVCTTIVVRCERAEQGAADAYQLRRQQCAEAILSELQSDMERSRSRTGSKRKISTDEDISFLKESLNSQQIRMIQEQNIEESSRIQQQLQDKLAKELDEKIPPRMVTRMLKVRLVSSCEDQSERGRSALLTVWNPSDEVLSLLAEGNSVVFHHLTASGYSRYGDMQLTGGRNTRYSVTRHSPVARTVTSLSSLRDSAFAPPFSEIDLVGLVLQVGNTNIADGKLLYIADASCNFLCISFSTEIKDTGYRSALSPGCLVAISCLHWRSHLVSWSLPNAFASELTSFTQNPRQPHLQKALAKLRQLTRPLNLKSYMEDCSGRIENLIKQRNSGGMTSSPIPEASGFNCPVSNSKHLEPHGTSRIDSSDRSRTLCDSSDPCVTPQNKRLLLLERFGEPPPISPLLTTTPQRVKQNFRPPMRKPLSENKSS